MKFNLWLLTLLSFMILSARSSFATMTAMELHDDCRWAQHDELTLTEEQHLKYAVCVSYVLGVTEGFYLGGGRSCVPNGENVTNTQLGMVVFKYLEEHPEELHLHSGALVIKALRKAFPCK